MSIIVRSITTADPVPTGVRLSGVPSLTCEPKVSQDPSALRFYVETGSSVVPHRVDKLVEEFIMKRA